MLPTPKWKPHGGDYVLPRALVRRPSSGGGRSLPGLPHAMLDDDSYAAALCLPVRRGRRSVLAALVRPLQLPSPAPGESERAAVESPPAAARPLQSCERWPPPPDDGPTVQRGHEGVAEALLLIDTCRRAQGVPASTHGGSSSERLSARSGGTRLSNAGGESSAQASARGDPPAGVEHVTLYTDLRHIKPNAAPPLTPVTLFESGATLVVVPDDAVGRWVACAARRHPHLRLVRYPYEQAHPAGLREGARVLVTQGVYTGREGVLRSAEAIEPSPSAASAGPPSPHSSRVSSEGSVPALELRGRRPVDDLEPLPSPGRDEWGVDLVMDDKVVPVWIRGRALSPLSPRSVPPAGGSPPREGQPPEAAIASAERLLSELWVEGTAETGVNRFNALSPAAGAAVAAHIADLRDKGLTAEAGTAERAAATLLATARQARDTLDRAWELSASVDVVLMTHSDFGAELASVRAIVESGAGDRVDNLASPILSTRFYRVVFDFGGSSEPPSSTVRDYADSTRLVPALHRWILRVQEGGDLPHLQPVRREIGDHRPEDGDRERAVGSTSLLRVASEAFLRGRGAIESHCAAAFASLQKVERGERAALEDVVCERHAHSGAAARCGWRPSSGSVAKWLSRMREQEQEVRFRPGVRGWWGKFDCVRTGELMPWRLLDQAGRGKGELAAVEADYRAALWLQFAEELFYLVGYRQEQADRSSATAVALSLLAVLGGSGALLGWHLHRRWVLLQENRKARERLRRLQLQDCADTELRSWDRLTLDVVRISEQHRRERLAIEEDEEARREDLSSREDGIFSQHTLAKDHTLQRWAVECAEAEERVPEEFAEWEARCVQERRRECSREDAERRVLQRRRGDARFQMLWAERLGRENLHEAAARLRVVSAGAWWRRGLARERALEEELLRGMFVLRAVRAAQLQKLKELERATRGAKGISCQREQEITDLMACEQEARERIWQRILMLVYEPCWQGWLRRTEREAEREVAQRARMHNDFIRVLRSLEGIRPAGYDPDSKWVATHAMGEATTRGDRAAAARLACAATDAQRTFRDEGLQLKPGCWLPRQGFQPQVFARVTAEEHLRRRRLVAQQASEITRLQSAASRAILNLCSVQAAWLEQTKRRPRKYSRIPRGSPVFRQQSQLLP